MSHLCLGPRKTMIRRQFRCILDRSRYGGYNEVLLNIPCFERENEPGQFIEKNSILVALLQRTTATRLRVFLRRGTTLKAFRPTPRLFACDNEEGGNCTLERSETGVPYGEQPPRHLRYSFPRFSKTFKSHNAACQGTAYSLAVRECAPLVARRVTSMLPGHARGLREKHAWRHIKS